MQCVQDEVTASFLAAGETASERKQAGQPGWHTEKSSSKQTLQRDRVGLITTRQVLDLMFSVAVNSCTFGERPAGQVSSKRRS